MKTNKYSYRKALQDLFQNILDDYVYYVMINKKVKSQVKLSS